MPYFRRRENKKRPAYVEETANWEKGWAILSSMQSLRDLRVVIVDGTPDQIWEGLWLALEDCLLEPVKAIVRPRYFELVLPYANCVVDRDMGESRVRLTKPIAEGDESV